MDAGRGHAETWPTRHKNSDCSLVMGRCHETSVASSMDCHCIKQTIKGGSHGRGLVMIDEPLGYILFGKFIN
jgi:hypothetical protein